MKSYLSIAIFAFPGFAGLVSPLVVKGEADVKQTGHHWDVRVSDRVLIDWERFSIGEQESAQFHQPNSLSIVVNRCTMGSPSEILGRLTANGHLVLVNPDGIYFGEHSFVEAAQFTASTYDLLDEAFLEGRLSFKNESSGSIAGDAYLKQEGEFGWIRVKPAAGIDVQGTIRAAQVTLLSDGDLFDLAINHEGIVEAKTIAFEGGKVLFKGDSLDISGKIETGLNGEIALVGKEIEVGDAAHLVSPSGNVFVGGGRHGKDARFINADRTVVKGSVDVSAIGDQQGGSVVLWSEKETVLTGKIEARGGEKGGDGGFVEVSSRGAFRFNWNVDLSAVKGRSGELLLDPTNVIITSMGPFTPGTTFMDTPPTSWPALTNPVIIDSAALSTFLNTMGSVTITTSVLPDPGAAGNLQVAPLSDVTWASTNFLTLTADNTLSIFSDLDNSAGAGSILLAAGVDLFIGPPPAGLTSVLTSLGPIDLTAITGNIVIEGGTTGLLDSGVLDCQFYSVAAAGDITLFCNTDGTAMIRSTVTANPCSVACGGNLTLSGSSSGAASLFATSAPISIAVGGDFIITSGNDNSGTDFGIPGATTTIAVAGDLLISRTGSGNALLDTGGDTNLIVGGAISIADIGLPGAALVGIMDSSMGNLTITAGGDVTSSIANAGGLRGIVAGLGDLSITTPGSVTANGASLIASGTGSIFIQAGVNVAINDTSTITFLAPIGTVTIVVDNNFPTSPEIGPGSLILGPSASINPLMRPVQIFTAVRSQNSVLGTINGVSFSPGPLNVDSDQERWGVYFPNAFVNPNSPFFTIFYKDTSQVLTFLAEPIFEFDIFRYLHPYDEYISLANRFFEKVSDGEGLLQPFQPYFLRKSTLRYTSFTMDRDNLEYSLIY